MRKTDDNQTSVRYFRAGDRLFRVEDQWFYATREGNEGPFASKELAERHLRSFIGLQDMKVDNQVKLDKIRDQRVDADPKVWNNQIDVI